MNIFCWIYWVVSLGNSKFKFSLLADKFILSDKCNYKTKVVKLTKQCFLYEYSVRYFRLPQSVQFQFIYFRDYYILEVTSLKFLDLFTVYVLS